MPALSAIEGVVRGYWDQTQGMLALAKGLNLVSLDGNNWDPEDLIDHEFYVSTPTYTSRGGQTVADRSRSVYGTTEKEPLPILLRIPDPVTRCYNSPKHGHPTSGGLHGRAGKGESVD